MTVREGEIHGWRSVTLENDRLRVTVLPEKGADVVELRDLATGTDPLFRAPWGLAPPGAAAREGSGDREFLWNYEGGWQTLFPNMGDAARYRGERIPFHGEVATLLWEYEQDEDAVVLGVRCRRTPFRLERRLQLDAGALMLDDRVVNVSGQPAHFVWAHHCVLGPPFLEAGCRLHLPAQTLVTAEAAWEDTDRLAPSQTSRWPEAQLRGGGTVRLDVVPGPEAGSHDDVYVTGLREGVVEVANERLGIAFRLEWDHDVFPWVNLWQPYGGAEAPPLRGTYALGVEPWSSSRNLERALEAGDASRLQEGEALTTSLRAEIVAVP